MGVNRVRSYFPDDDPPIPAPVLADDGEGDGPVSAEVAILDRMTGVIELIARRLTAIEAKVDALARLPEDI